MLHKRKEDAQTELDNKLFKSLYCLNFGIAWVDDEHTYKYRWYVYPKLWVAILSAILVAFPVAGLIVKLTEWFNVPL